MTAKIVCHPRASECEHGDALIWPPHLDEHLRRVRAGIETLEHKVQESLEAVEHRLTQDLDQKKTRRENGRIVEPLTHHRWR